jgi:hypothetical protein
MACSLGNVAGREHYFEIERETQAEKKSPGYSRG